MREALTMVAVQVFGNDNAVAFAGSQGNFQLNVYKPRDPAQPARVGAAALRGHARVRPVLCARASEPDDRASGST